jgi:replicative DNA helicase
LHRTAKLLHECGTDPCGIKDEILQHVEQHRQSGVDLPVDAAVQIVRQLPGLADFDLWQERKRRAQLDSSDSLPAIVVAPPDKPTEPAMPENDGASADEGYRFQPIDSKTFFTTNYALEWLVQRVLVKDQPAVLGGPKKTLKTSTLIDLAVSLATATPFLGWFEVYKRHRVVIISGESGEAVLQECGRRVCKARDLNPEQLGLWWGFRLPQVANVLDRQELCRGLKELGASVVIIDLLYLCLLAGMDARDVEAGNLYKMGPLLSALCRACLEAGCTPILCHHARKGSGQNYAPLDLDDLSFSGIAEFARQWILENRREAFNPDTGSSKLWLSVGGSAGQSGCWAVDVEEGVLQDDFSGRKWEVTVHTAAEMRAENQMNKRAAKREEQAKGDQEDDMSVMAALDRLDPEARGFGYNRVQVEARLSDARMMRAVNRLRQEQLVKEAPVSVTIGSGAERNVRGLMRMKERDGRDHLTIS